MEIPSMTKFKMNFCEKLESVHYKAMLVIAGDIQGTSRDKIYQELGLEILNIEDGTNVSAACLK